MATIVGGYDTGLLDTSLYSLNRDDKTQEGELGHGEEAYVNVSNGNLVVTHTDAYLPSQGEDYALVRTYNSRGSWDSNEGDGWTFSSAVRLSQRPTGEITLVNPDASLSQFHPDPNDGDRYVSVDGAGAYEIITFDNVSKKYTLVRSDQTRLIFDNVGNLLEKVDLNGNYLRYEYVANKLVGVKDGFIVGADETIVHNIEYRYPSNDLEEIWDVTDPDNTIFLARYRYSGGNLTEAEDRYGHITTYSYYTDGTLRSISLPVAEGEEQRQIEFVYTTNSETNSTVLKYISDGSGGMLDALGNPSPNANITEFIYDFTVNGPNSYEGGVTGMIDAEGRFRYLSNSTEYVQWRLENGYYELYDQAKYGVDAEFTRQVDEIKANHTTTYTYNDQGLITEVRDVKFVGTSQSYENITTYEYDTNENLTCITDAVGYSLTTSDASYYRDLRKQYGCIDPLTGEGKLVADLTEQDETYLKNRHRTWFFYDGNGNIIEKITNLTDPSEANLPTSDWVSAEHTVYEYTDFNKIETETSAVGYAMAYSNDAYYQAQRSALGYPADATVLTQAQREALSVLYTTKYEYDAKQNLAKIYSLGSPGDYTEFFYNSDGTVQKKIEYSSSTQEQRITAYAYDVWGNNNKVIQPNAFTIVSSDDPYWQEMRKTFGIVDADGNGKLVSALTPTDTAYLKSKYTTHSTYDYFGNRKEFIDANGNITTYTYDKDNRLTQVQDASHLTKFMYDSVGNRTEVEFTLDGGATHSVVYKYDKNNMLLHVRDWTADGSGAEDRSTDYTYDAVGQMTSVTDAEGNTTTYTYREDHRLVEVTTPIVAGADGASTTYTTTYDYDGLGNRITVKDHNGNITRYVYDQTGLVKQVTEPTGNITQYRYDANHNQIQIVIGAQLSEAQRRVLNYRYDEENQLVVEVDAEGNTTRYHYDGFDDLIGVTNAIGAAIISSDDAYYRDLRKYYGYVDANGDGLLVADLSTLQKEALQALFTRTFQYDASGNMIREHRGDMRDPVTGTWVSCDITHYFDGNGNEIATTDENGNTTRLTYDKDNKVVMIEDANGVKAVFTYDARHNKTGVYIGVQAHQDATGHVVIDSLADAQVTTYKYDEFNQLKSRLDGVGNALLTSDEQIYRDMRKEMNIVDVNGDGKLVAALDDSDKTTIQGAYTERYSYNRVGNLTSAIDNAGNVTVVEYDAMQRLVAETDALGNRTSYHYDGNGNRVAITDAIGNALISSDAELYQQKRIALGYSATVAGLSDADKAALAELYTTHFAYDSADRLTDITNANDVVTHREYDHVGNLLSETAAYGATAARTTQWTYDLNNRVTKRTDPETAFQSFEYDAVGNRIKVTDGRGNATRYVYDALNRTLKVIDPLSFETRYEYDRADNRLAIIDARGAITRVEYDPGNRLVSTTDAEGRVTRVAYDVRGNRISVVDGNGNALVSSDDSYWRNLRQQHGYLDINGDGKLAADLTDEEKSALRGLYTTHYEYDAGNHLRAVVDAEGNRTEHDYDNVYNRTAITDGNGHTTTYHFDAIHRTIEVNDPEGGKTTYSYDAVGNRLSVTDANGYAIIGSDEPYYLSRRAELGYVDGLGEPLPAAALTEAQKAELLERSTTHYEYDRVGQMMKQVGHDDVVTAFAYDPVGNRTDVIVAYGTADAQHTTYVYDKNNRLTATIDAIGNGLVESDAQEYQDLRAALNHPLLVGALTPEQKTALLALHTTRTEYDENGNAVRVIDALGRTTEYVYDANNRVSGIVDPIGVGLAESNAATYQAQREALGNGYPANATLLTDTQKAELKDLYSTTYTYDAAGNRIQVEDALDHRTTTYYNGNGEVTYTVDAEGGVVGYAYDASGNTIGMTRYANALGVPADPQVLPAVVTSSDDQTTRYHYDGRNLLVRTMDPMGYVVDREYDAAGNLKGTVAYATKVVYDATLSLLHQNVALNRGDRLSSYIYDTNNRLIEKTDADGYSTTYDYDAVGNRVSVVAGQYFGRDSSKLSLAHVVTTSYVYDDMNRLVRERNALGIETEYHYDVLGNRTSVIEARGSVDARTTTYVYDDMNRVVETHNPEGTITRYVYDAVGQTSEIHEAYGRDGADGRGAERVTYNTYDGNGRVTRTTHPDDTVTEFTYDALGNLTERIDAAGNPADARRTTFVYDKTNRVTDQTVGTGIADAITTHYEYDAFGNRELEVIGYGSPEAVSTQYFFDLNNRLKSQLDGNGIITVYGYDAFGNMTSRSITDAASGKTETVSMEYDGRDLVIGNENGEHEVIASTYDASGNLRFVTRGVATTEFRYDLGNRLTDKIVDTRDKRLTTHYTYDDRGNLTSETQGYGTPDARTVITEYDSMNRATKVTDALEFFTSFSYDVFGNQIAITTGQHADPSKSSVATTRYAYDAMDRQVLQSDALGVVTTFDYDDRGNLTAKTEAYGYLPPGAAVLDANIVALEGSAATVEATSARTTTYTYDAVDRLVDETQPIGTVVHHEYDGAGRLKAKTVDYGVGVEYINAKTQYFYDAGGRLEWEVNPVGNLTQYEYDSFGNVIRETRGMALSFVDGVPVAATTADVRVKAFVYDLANRLSQEIVDPDGLALTTTYEYDERGNQTAITDANGHRGESVYDKADRLIWQRDAEGGVVAYDYDARGNKITETRYYNTGEGLDLGDFPTDSAHDRTTRYEYDLENRLRQRTDAAGIVNTLTYDAVGNIKTDTQNASGVGSPSRTTYYEYNKANLVTRQSDPSGLITEFDYDALYNVTRKITTNTWADTLHPDVNGIAPVVSQSQVTDYAYDANNRLTDVIVDAGGLALHTGYRYNALGNTIAEINPNGYAAPTDDSAWAQKIREDLGLVDSNGVIPAAQLTTEQQQKVLDALTTRTYYDAAGRAKFTVEPLGHVYYDAMGNAIFTQEPLGRVSEVVYDRAGNMIKAIQYAEEIYTAYLNDVTPPVPEPDTAKDRSVVYEYDKANRQTKTILGPVDIYVKNADGTYTEQVGAYPTTEKVYDGVGNVIRDIDANGNVTYNYYDGRGLLVGRLDAEGYLTKNEYDAFGNLQYETLYLKAQSQLTDVQKATLDIDTYIPDGAGRTIEHQYDFAGNEIKTVYPAAEVYVDGVGTVTESIEVDRTFDGYGNLLTETVKHAVSDQNPAETTFEYDAAGRLIKETDVRNNVKTYSYDDAGNLRETNDAGRITTFEYDLANRTTVIHMPAFDAVEVNADGVVTTTAAYRFQAETQYDAAGNLIREIKTDGSEIHYQYDLANRKTAAIDQNGIYTEYGYNAAGDRTLIYRYFTPISGDPLIAKAPGESASDQKIEFVVDRLGRVVEEHQYGDHSTSSDDRTTVMGYDANGNQVFIRDPRGYASILTFDGLNRVEATLNPGGGLTKTVYDAEGNVASQEVGAMSAPALLDNARITLSYISDEGAIASWRTSTATNATLYVRRANSTDAWTTYGNANAYTTDHHLMLNGLAANTEYEYYLEAEDNFGHTMTTFVTDAQGNPDHPTFHTAAGLSGLAINNLTANPAGGYAATLTFGVPDNGLAPEVVVGGIGATNDPFALGDPVVFSAVQQPDGSYTADISFDGDPATTLFTVRWTDATGAVQFCTLPEAVAQEQILRELNVNIFAERVDNQYPEPDTYNLTANWVLPRDQVDTYLAERTDPDTGVTTTETVYKAYAVLTADGTDGQTGLREEATLNPDGSFGFTFEGLPEQFMGSLEFQYITPEGESVIGGDITLPPLNYIDDNDERHYQQLVLDFPGMDTTGSTLDFKYRKVGTTTWLSRPVSGLSVDILGLSGGDYEYQAKLISGGVVQRSSQGNFTLGVPRTLSDVAEQVKVLALDDTFEYQTIDYTVDGPLLGFLEFDRLGNLSWSLTVTNEAGVTTAHPFENEIFDTSQLPAGAYSFHIAGLYNGQPVEHINGVVNVKCPANYVLDTSILSFPDLGLECTWANIEIFNRYGSRISYSHGFTIDLQGISPGEYTFSVVAGNGSLTSPPTREITGRIVIDPFMLADTSQSVSGARHVSTYNLSAESSTSMQVILAEAVEPDGSPVGADHIYNYYDDNGQLLFSNQDGGVWTRYFHDAQGNVTREVKFRYGPVDSVQDLAEAPMLADLIAGFGVAYATHDPANDIDNIREVTRAYDAAGNLLQETVHAHALTGGQVTSEWQYDAWGNKTLETTAKGIGGEELRTEYAYDSMNRLETVTFGPFRYFDSEGQDHLGTASQTFTYDRYGHRSTQTNERGYVEAFHYNANGQLKSQWNAGTLGANGVITGATLRTDYEYDYFGRVATKKEIDVVDPLNTVTHKTSYTYTNFDQQKLRTTQLGSASEFATVSMAYDQAGNNTSETDARGNKELFFYDGANRLTQRVDQLGSLWQTSYDTYGNKISEIDPNGRVTKYVIGAFGQVESVTTTLTGPVWANTISSEEYEATAKKLQEAYASDDIGLFEYLEKLGKLRSQTHNIAENTQANTEITTYDWTGAQKTVTGGGKDVRYSYDDAGRLTKIDSAMDLVDPFNSTITAKDRQVVTYGYDNRGNRISETLTQGAALLRDQSYSYNARGWLTGAEVQTYTLYQGVDLAKTIAVSYMHDETGNRVGVRNGVDGAYTGGHYYTFDARNRLQYVVNADTGATEHALTYDGFGNRKTDITASGTVTYEYDYANRVTSSSANEHWSYDANGNTLTHTQADDQSTENRYDAANRVVYTHNHSYSDGDWNDIDTNLYYDAAGNLGVTRVFSDDYAYDEITTLDVSYNTQRKYLMNTWADGARGLSGESKFYYDVNGQLTLVDRGMQQTNMPFIVGIKRYASFVYDNEGHILAQNNTRSLLATPQFIQGSHTDPDATYVEDEYGASETETSVTVKLLDLDSLRPEISLNAYVYANGHQIAETALDQDLVHKTVKLDPLESQAITFPSDHKITLQSADIVTVNGVLDRQATARKIAARVYKDFEANYQESTKEKITAYLVERLATLSDTQVVAGTQLSVWGYIQVTEASQQTQQTTIDYTLQNIGGEKGLPGGAVMNHTVQWGDTLQSVAAAYLGSPSYWYLIADANGLTGAEELKTGTRLTIPNVVANSISDKDTYKVYNESEIIGSSTSPEIRVKKKKKSFAQKLVQVAIFFAVAVAIYYIGVYAVEAMKAAVAAGGLGAFAAAVGKAAIVGYAAGYATSYATQTMAIAADLQEEYDWNAMEDMGSDFTVTSVAAGLGAWASTIGSTSWQSVAKGGIQAGAQAVRNDGDINNVSGIALAMLPAPSKLGDKHWLYGTASFVKDKGLNNVSAGLAVLEASIRGDDQTLSWANLVATVAAGPQPEPGQFRFFEGAGLKWPEVALDAFVAGGLSMVVGSKFGEDAALSFLGTALGNSFTGVMGEYGVYAQEQESLAHAKYQAAIANAIEQGAAGRHGDWEMGPSQFGADEVMDVALRSAGAESEQSKSASMAAGARGVDPLVQEYAKMRDAIYEVMKTEGITAEQKRASIDGILNSASHFTMGSVDESLRVRATELLAGVKISAEWQKKDLPIPYRPPVEVVYSDEPGFYGTRGKPWQDPMGTMYDPNAEAAHTFESEDVHTALDTIGAAPVPGLGEVADGTNAVLYLLEGRKGEAALAGFSALPVVGLLGSIAKWGGKVSDVASTLKHAEDVVPDSVSLSQLGARIDEVAAEKNVYLIKGNDNYVVALQREPNIGYLNDEVNALNALNDLGVPTVKNYGIVDVGGQPGILLERVPGAVSSKSISEGTGLLPGANISNLNQQTIADLQHIRSLLIEKNVGVGDLQFLIGNNGRVVINDPMNVTSRFSPWDIHLIDELIDIARRGGG